MALALRGSPPRPPACTRQPTASFRVLIIEGCDFEVSEIGKRSTRRPDPKIATPIDRKSYMRVGEKKGRVRWTQKIEPSCKDTKTGPPPIYSNSYIGTIEIPAARPIVLAWPANFTFRESSSPQRALACWTPLDPTIMRMPALGSQRLQLGLHYMLRAQVYRNYGNPFFRATMFIPCYMS